MPSPIANPVPHNGGARTSNRTTQGYNSNANNNNALALGVENGRTYKLILVGDNVVQVFLDQVEVGASCEGACPIYMGGASCDWGGTTCDWDGAI